MPERTRTASHHSRIARQSGGAVGATRAFNDEASKSGRCVCSADRPPFEGRMMTVAQQTPPQLRIQQPRPAPRNGRWSGFRHLLGARMKELAREREEIGRAHV